MNYKLTTGLLIWKLGCLISLKARHKENKVLLTESKWEENLTENAQEATISNNKECFKLKGPVDRLLNNCTAVSPNKENAYILCFIFMTNKVTRNLIKL